MVKLNLVDFETIGNRVALVSVSFSWDVVAYQVSFDIAVQMHHFQPPAFQPDVEYCS